MKYFKLYETFTKEQYDFLDKQIFKGKILYRGIDDSMLAMYKDEKIDNIGKFFSTDEDFAGDYGDNIIEVELLTNNVFNSIDPRKIHELYDLGFKLRDEYMGMGGIKNSNYDYKKDEYPTAEDFLKAAYSDSDTWEVIEHSYGVLEHIMSDYDACIIYEGGIQNFYIEDSKHYKVLNIDRRTEKDITKLPDNVEGGLTPDELRDEMNKNYY